MRQLFVHQLLEQVERTNDVDVFDLTTQNHVHFSGTAEAYFLQASPPQNLLVAGIITHNDRLIITAIDLN